MASIKPSEISFVLEEVIPLTNKIDTKFDFPTVIKSILNRIKEKTYARELTLSEVLADGSVRALYQSDDFAVSGDHKRPLLSFPIFVGDRHISFILDVYRVENNILPEPDLEKINNFVELIISKAIEKYNLQKDPLTRVFNRRYLDEHLADEQLRAQKEQKPLGFVMVDIDHFKQFNDSYGHDVGDVVLRTVAATLDDVCRQESTRKGRTDPADFFWVARYGGEEFSLVTPLSSVAETVALAEQVRKAIETLKLTSPEGVDLRLTASFGVSGYPEHGTDINPDDLMKFADVALYQAKQAGRNRTQVFDQSCLQVMSKTGTITTRCATKGEIVPAQYTLDTVLKQELFVTFAKQAGNFSPTFICTDYGRELIYFISPPTSRIYGLKDDGHTSVEFGEHGDGKNQLSQPGGIFIDNNGNIWIADMGNHAIKQFNSRGQLLRVLGKIDATGLTVPALAHEKGGFDRPRAVVMDSQEQIIVAEPYQHRVQRFLPTGEFHSQIRVFGNPDDSNYPAPEPIALVVDKADRLYALDSKYQTIWVYDRNDGYVTRFGRYGHRPDDFDTAVGMVIIPPNRFARKLAELRVIPEHLAEEELLLTVEGGSIDRLKVISLQGEVVAHSQLDFRPGGITADWDGRIYLINLADRTIVRFEVAL